MLEPTVVPVRASGCASRAVGEETLLFAESGDELHTLNEVGSFIWGVIDGKRSLGAIVDSVCETYEVGRAIAEEDVARFMEELVAKGILSLARPA